MTIIFEYNYVLINMRYSRREKREGLREEKREREKIEREKYIYREREGGERKKKRER